MFISLMRFLLQSLVSRSFLVHLRFSFLFISFISAYLMVSASNTPKILKLSFSPSVWILFWFSTPFVCLFFYLFLLLIVSIAYFSVPNFIPVSWFYILIVCIRASNSFSVYFPEDLYCSSMFRLTTLVSGKHKFYWLLKKKKTLKKQERTNILGIWGSAKLLIIKIFSSVQVKIIK